MPDKMVDLWETGEREIDSFAVQILAQKYKISKDWLLSNPLKNGNTQQGNNINDDGINIQHSNVTLNINQLSEAKESIKNSKDKSAKELSNMYNDIEDLINLLLEFGTPSIARQFKLKMLEIKNLHE